MNSSAIRLFIDWLERAKASKSGYSLHFITNSTTTWRRSTFSAVKALGGNRVTVSTVS